MSNAAKQALTVDVAGLNESACLNSWYSHSVSSSVSHLAVSNHAVVTAMNYTGFTGENNFPRGRLRSTTGEQLLYKRVGIAIRRRAVSNA
jgi:hypothetical protein